MTRDLFNDGWTFRSRVTAFMELGGSAASAWQQVALPHDALIGSERRADAHRGETSGYHVGGAFEYKKTFALSEELRGRQLLVEFDGVYRDASVFVNGNLAGQRALGYSRFFVQIDPYLNFGADNEIRVECRTHADSRWYSGAGIYRDVHLVVKNPLHIATDGVVITTPDVDAERAVVELAVEVENSSALTSTLMLATAIGAVTTSAPITLLPGTRGTVRHRVYLSDPELWSVESPHLYKAALTLREGDVVVDEQTVSFGVRTLQLDPQRGLCINGESVKLRGACIHSDNGPLGAVSVRAAEERKIALLKEAGFNAIRSAHNPLSSAVLDACDKLGMLVMDETFDMWTQGKSDYDYAFDFPEWWERDVEAMVARDINHPSVIFYSIGNEIPETGNPIGSTWGRKLAEKVRSLDSTRYVTNGINPFVSMLDTIIPQMQARRDAAAAAPEGGVNTMMAGFGQMMNHIQGSEPASQRTEESFSVLDVAGLNYGDARYELDRELFPNRILVGSETWPQSIAGNWERVLANGHVIGDFTWTGWDYLGETAIGGTRYADEAISVPGAASGSFSAGFPELTAWTGDIDIVGIRRPVSYFREIVFGLRSDPYIAVNPPANFGREILVATPWAWGDAIENWTWDGSEGKQLVVDVYSGAEEVELLVNGSPVGRQPVTGFRVSFETRYQPGAVAAVGYVGGVETGRFEICSAAPSIVLDVTAERAELRTDGTDLGYVALTLTDGGGVVHTESDRLVSVSISGPAVLQAFGSGNPITVETFGSPDQTSFHGRALAILRPTGAGQITVTAVTEGSPPASVTLSAS